MLAKEEFFTDLVAFAATLDEHVSREDRQWSVKGFIDAFRSIYTISSDTKIVSKILEIHLFPRILQFATEHGFKLVLAEHQNHYPDISFVLGKDESVKFAVDFKTTYRSPSKPWLCNGFTLGSHGKYFQDRTAQRTSDFLMEAMQDIFVSELSMTAPSGPRLMRQNRTPWRN